MVVFHPAGKRHGQVHESCVHTLNVQIDEGWMRRVFDAVGPLDRAIELHDEGIVAAALRIPRVAFGQEPDSALGLEALVWEVLGAAASGHPSPHHRRPRWLDAARELLEHRFRDPMDLRELAEAAGVHPVHFAATFRRVFGVSVGEHRRRLRLEFVQRRLRDPDVSLSDVAAEAGFSDQSHMTRCFKRHAGTTPAAYRALMTFKTGRTRRP